jgi:hypothetical protein
MINDQGVNIRYLAMVPPREVATLRQIGDHIKIRSGSDGKRVGVGPHAN